MTGARVEQGHNPYLPPKARLDETDAPAELHLATRGRRFWTFIVDKLFIIGLVFVSSFTVGLLVGEKALPWFSGWRSYLFGVAIGVAYYVFFETLWGRTAGKWVCGTRVVSEEGRTPTFRTIVLRSVCRYIPFEPFSFFGERGSHGWHDGLSKTRVVLVRAP